ncbi:Uncharacterized conserved protein, DUF1684 family [Lentzea xinjiangensis]|uniref:Uncharacterized conserved protein, DUF1684 family n=1 Tax=Lentzea xinjiangensis TaxID=402600 RepID=A0A1H9V4T4_9PSEU|nr:DUF1684 domain-containing protein [Lentzea xinjiangensis]SES16414.1 Uncharacterized conserved protein, DUF1684 family [Lentzea xinjiangensis]
MTYDDWRAARWDEIAGQDGKAKVVAKGTVAGGEPQVLPGIPGEWRVDDGGALTLTVGGGRSEVGSTFDLPGGLRGFAGGADGRYGVVVLDPRAPAWSSLRGIDTYPPDPAWVFEGRFRAAPDRRVDVEHLTSPRTTKPVDAPADLVVTINGTEHVLTVLETMPGQRLVVFTDETSGAGTPDIGRWLVLPPAEPGTGLAVDFNRATLSHHHLVPAVFTCPLAPPGNHLPIRVEAGERALVHDLKDKATTYLRHLENRAWDDARAMCSQDATVWHNDGKGDSTIDENIAGMAAQIGSIESMRYDVTRQFDRPGEVMRQHVVNVVMEDGAVFAIDAAVYFRFENGLITRIEEYASLPSR